MSQTPQPPLPKPAAHESLRTRVLLPALLLSLLVMAVGGYYLHHTLGNSVEQLSQSRVKLMLGALQAASETVADDALLQRHITALAADRDVHTIAIVGGRPARVLASNQLHWLGLPVANVAELQVHGSALEAALGRRESGWHPGDSELQLVTPLMLFANAESNGQLRPAAVYVHLDTRTLERERRDTEQRIAVILLSLLVVLLLVLFGALTRGVLHPGQRILDTVLRYQRGEREARIRLQRRDELGQLADTLDQLLDHEQQANARIRDLNELYRTLSETNQIIVRDHGDAADLLARICRVTVEHAHVRAAWAAIREPDQPRMRLLAHEGMPAGFEQLFNDGQAKVLEQWRHSLDDGRAFVCNRLERDLGGREPSPWFMLLNCRSFTLFPLISDGKVVGVLSLLSDIEDFFTDARLALLNELAEDVSFALANQRHEAERIETARRLAEREERLSRVFSLVPDMLTVSSARDGRYLEVNRNWERVSGYSRAEAIGRTSVELGLWNSPADRERLVAKLVAQGEVREEIVPFRARSGELVMTQVSGTLSNEGDDPIIILAVRDITAKLAMDEQLRLAARVLENTREAIVVTDAEGAIVSVNPAFSALTGFSIGDVHQRRLQDIADQQGAARDNEIEFELDRAGNWQGEFWLQRKNGERFPVWLQISTILDSQQRRCNQVINFADLSEQKAAAERIAFLAYHDALTSLPNPALLRDRAAQALAFARADDSLLAVLCLDLDRFKNINESLGHAMGDQLLQAVVQRLNQILRPTDTFSRLGGDNFILLLPELAAVSEAAQLARQWIALIEEPFNIDGHTLSISASVGVSIFPEDGDDFDTLLKKSDTALYHAKESGRGTFRFFKESMDANMLEQLALETQLRLAIEREQLSLHYQPQMDLHSGELIGVEALLRWQHPEQGMISPGRFIPIAEASGLIIPIGRWVLREACRQNREWQQQGLPPMVVSVNLSALQFRRDDPVDLVADVLDETGLHPRWLELELTESILMDNQQAALDVMRRLKAMGVHLAIDDFGTGYSSLSYLTRFAVDKLKIDQAFVRDVNRNPDDANIVRAIIQLGHNLNLKVIAEGTETAEQIALLKREGCDQAQGYFFSRPVPADELKRFVEARRPKA